MRHLQTTLILQLIVSALLVVTPGSHYAQEPDAAAAPDGTIHVPAFDLPLSGALSPEARASLVASQRASGAVSFPSLNDIKTEQQFADYVTTYRRGLDERFAKPLAETVMAATSVKIRSSKIAGVPVEEFEPANGIAPNNTNRVLINLHGGAFFAGAVHLGRVESAPIAALGRIKVVSVDYRQAYEHKFPAASEDVAAVFGELTKQYPPRNVGIYGCSAGGALTAQATAWLLDKGLPVPGAIGIFGSGAGRGRGDAMYFSAIAAGQNPPPAAAASVPASRAGGFGYFSAAKSDDRLVNPLVAPELLAKFPPTLLITATRATDMSSAIETHRALTRASVDTSLQVFDGLGHCFIYQHTLPEAQDANATIVRFFDRHLGK